MKLEEEKSSLLEQRQELEQERAGLREQLVHLEQKVAWTSTANRELEKSCQMAEERREALGEEMRLLLREKAQLRDHLMQVRAGPGGDLPQITLLPCTLLCKSQASPHACFSPFLSRGGFAVSQPVPGATGSHRSRLGTRWGCRKQIPASCCVGEMTYSTCIPGAEGVPGW